MEIRDMGSQFECQKVGMRHTKDGHLLTLAIHPNDTPEDLMRDFVGQRYVAVLVRVDDQDKPVPEKTKGEVDAAVKLAATLCHDEKFQGWLCFSGLSDDVNKEAAVKGLRAYLEIASRAELKENKRAREKLFGLRDEFINEVRKSGWKRDI